MAARRDPLGDQCKLFEEAESSRRAMPGLPILVRLDGRSFHAFTSSLGRPFDARFGHCMVETTRHLVQEFSANIGYTQSDEITLVFRFARGANSPYSGRHQKIVSATAGMASALFARLALEHLPETAQRVPSFDSRVWQVPDCATAVDALAWREADATKNSLAMAARAHFSHDQLLEKSSAELHELLHTVGVNWNDYPPHFKRGLYLRRGSQGVQVLDMPPIRRVVNAVEVVFDADLPAPQESA